MQTELRSIEITITDLDCAAIVQDWAEGCVSESQYRAPEIDMSESVVMMCTVRLY